MSYIIYDLETTGFRHWEDEIIQIAAKVFPTGEEFEAKLTFYIDKASPEALKVNSYDPEVWARCAVEPEEALMKFDNFVKEFAIHPRISARGKRYTTAVAMGHNNTKFDNEFLRRLYKNNGDKFFPFTSSTDTLQLITFLYPDLLNYKQGSIMEAFGLPSQGAHDALEDVRQLFELLHKVVAQLCDGTLTPYFSRLLQSIPASHASNQAQQAPQAYTPPQAPKVHTPAETGQDVFTRPAQQDINGNVVPAFQSSQPIPPGAITQGPPSVDLTNIPVQDTNAADITSFLNPGTQTSPLEE